MFPKTHQSFTVMHLGELIILSYKIGRTSLEASALSEGETQSLCSHEVLEKYVNDLKIHETWSLDSRSSQLHRKAHQNNPLWYIMIDARIEQPHCAMESRRSSSK